MRREERRFPIIGDGGGVFSYIHVEDAAAATAIAVERGEAGIYNVADDDPAPAREWLPAIGCAPSPPRRPATSPGRRGMPASRSSVAEPPSRFCGM
jgi:nucleoside-diphosphate-sugar epimerase